MLVWWDHWVSVRKIDVNTMIDPERLFACLLRYRHPFKLTFIRAMDINNFFSHSLLTDWDWVIQFRFPRNFLSKLNKKLNTSKSIAADIHDENQHEFILMVVNWKIARRCIEFFKQREGCVLGLMKYVGLWLLKLWLMTFNDLFKLLSLMMFGKDERIFSFKNSNKFKSDLDLRKFTLKIKQKMNLTNRRVSTPG